MGLVGCIRENSVISTERSLDELCSVQKKSKRLLPCRVEDAGFHMPVLKIRLFYLYSTLSYQIHNK